LKPGTYTLVLQWSDPFYSLSGTTGVTADLDLYLFNVAGLTMVGFNRSNLFGDPFEVCPFYSRRYNNSKLMIVNATGTTGNIRLNTSFLEATVPSLIIRMGLQRLSAMLMRKKP
jgi:hypothetical protein